MTVSEDVWRAVQGNEPPSPREERGLVSLFGTARVLAPLRQGKGSLVDLTPLGQARLAGMLPCRVGRRRQGTLLVIADYDRMRPEVLAAQAVDHLHRLAGPDFGFGVSDLLGEFPTLTRGEHPIDQQSRLATEPTFEAAGRLFLAADPRGRFVLGASCPLPPVRSWVGTRWQWVTAVTVVVWGLLLAAVRRGLGVGWSLPRQILGLFGLAAGGGVCLLLGLAGQALAGRQEAAIRGRQAQAAAILMHLDDGFRAFRVQLERRFQRFSDRLQGQSPAVMARLLRQGFPARWREWFHVMLFDREGRWLCHLPPPTQSTLQVCFGKAFANLFSTIARVTLKVWDWRKSRVGAPMPAWLDDQPATIRYGVRNMLRGEGITDLVVPQGTMARYARIILDQEGHPVFLLVVLEKLVDQRLYFRNRQRTWRFSGREGGFPFRLHSLEASSRRARPLMPEVQRLVDRLSQTGGNQFEPVRHRGRDWMMVGRRGGPGGKLPPAGVSPGRDPGGHPTVVAGVFPVGGLPAPVGRRVGPVVHPRPPGPAPGGAVRSAGAGGWSLPWSSPADHRGRIPGPGRWDRCPSR